MRSKACRLFPPAREERVGQSDPPFKTDIHVGLLTPLAKERGYSSAQARGAAKKVALTVWAGVGVPGSYGHLFEAEAMERHSGGVG